METEDIVELGIIALIVVAVGFILYEAFGFLSESGATGGIASALSPLTKAASTLTSSDASTPLSDSNLFYSGIDNFFNTGSIYNGGTQ